MFGLERIQRLSYLRKSFSFSNFLRGGHRIVLFLLFGFGLACETLLSQRGFELFQLGRWHWSLLHFFHGGDAQVENIHSKKSYGGAHKATNHIKLKLKEVIW